MNRNIRRLSTWACISFRSVDLGYVLHRQRKGVDVNGEAEKGIVEYSRPNGGEESFDTRLCAELSLVTNCLGQRNLRAIYNTRLSTTGTSYFVINTERFKSRQACKLLVRSFMIDEED